MSSTCLEQLRGVPEGFPNKSMEGKVLVTFGGGSNLGGDMIDTKGVAKTLLQYRHTLVLGIWNSPAQILLGRTPKDALPTRPQKL